MQQTLFGSTTGRLVQISDGNHAFVPPDLPPAVDLSWTLVTELSAADRKLSELAGAARNLPNPHLLIAPFSRREAVLSSKIEGTVASLSDLFSFEALGTVPTDRADVIEVANYVHALEYGLGRVRELPISLRLFRELHERLMKNVRGQNLMPGEFRNRQNWIGPPGTDISNALYVPPPVSEMHACLGALEKYIHSESDLPPLIRMAIIHYQFEAIHPFLDGNGRIGRLLITLMLVNWGLMPQPLLYLSAYFERHRKDYYRLLQGVSQDSDWISWINFFLRGVSQQSQEALRTAMDLQTIWQQYRIRMQEPRQSAAMLTLVDNLFRRPVLTVASAAKMLNVTAASAQANIDKLSEAHILKEVTGKQRGRIYIAQEIFKILEG